MKQFSTLFLAMAAMLAPQTLHAQTQQDQVELQFTGTPWGVLGVSANNRYIVGTRQYTEVYSYDTKTKKLLTIPATNPDADLAGVDITNSGVIIGKDNDMVPAIYTDAWHKLPVPEGKFQGLAYSCTGEGDILVGQVYGSGTDKPYKVYPLIWNIQEDGTYKMSYLPDPQTDFLGAKTQFNSPRFISDDGSLITGVQVEERGRYFTTIVYTRDEAGAWVASTPFVKYCYNVDRFKELSASEPNINDYISGGGNYKENLNRFLSDQAKWQYRLYTEGLTGFMLSANAINSQNGKYLAFSSQRTTYTLIEENPSVEKNEGPAYPSIYNTETGELQELSFAENFVPYGISNQGDMIYSDGYFFYLLLHGAQEAINITDWLKEKYNYDLMANLPSNTKYVECEAIGTDLSFLAGTYRSVKENGNLDKKEVFCLLLPSTATLIEALNTAESERIWVENRQICFSSPVTQACVYDINGIRVNFQSEVEHGMDMGSAPAGVYIVKALCNGQEVKGRIIIR